MLKSLFGKSRPAPRVPEGERVYAIGDIHGRVDCFDALLDRIVADDARRGPARTRLVLLGDLIDRGPDSRGVVARALTLSQSWAGFAQLMGNHEELLLRSAKGDKPALSLFDRAGGRETLLSYGVPAERYDDAHLTDLETMIARHVPSDHMAFLAAGERMVTIGDYCFVHAGIRPKVPLDEQKETDLRWIREPFLSNTGWHGAMIVHGHTITEQPDIHSNRIGIDTGAFATGRLTALGLEGGERWFLETGPA